MALNQELLLPTFYAPPDDDDEVKPQYWRGLRLIGVDGTDLVLPDAPELLAVFGGRSFKIADRHKPWHPYYGQTRPGALAVVSYDLLNHLAVDARFKPAPVMKP